MLKYKEAVSAKGLSRVASAIQASTTMTIDAISKRTKADGVDVTGFGVRESSSNTLDNIKAIDIAAIEQNATRYTPAASTVGLCQAVCGCTKADYGLEYKPSRAVVSNDAEHLAYLTLRVVVNPDDEVILPMSYWMGYVGFIKMMGGMSVVVTATEIEHFELTAEKLSAAITPKIKAILSNNPSNSTGTIYDRGELEAVTAVCIQADIYVISDGVYACLTYDGRVLTGFVSLSADAKERTILVNDVSKTYAMTGWRIGCTCVDDITTKMMVSYVSHSTGSPVAISQRVAVMALPSSQAKIETMRQAFEQCRNYIVERTNVIPGVSCIQLGGAFYVMMNPEQFLGKTIHGVGITNNGAFADAFLKYDLVAVVPGSGFGALNFVRWSYATSMENVREDLDRLEKFSAE